MKWVVTVDVLGICALAVACVAWIIPAANTSLFRYRLWRLRDELYDDLAAGGFIDVACGQSFREHVERTIVMSKEMTMFRLWLIHALYPSADMVKPAFMRPHSLCTEDRDKLKKYMDRYHSMVFRHIALGTPSGWIAMVFVAPLALVLAIGSAVRGTLEGVRVSVYADTRHRVRNLSTEYTATPEYAVELSEIRLTSNDAASALAHSM